MTKVESRLLSLEEELSQRARQQAVVAELGQQALIGIDLQTLMDETVKQIAQTLDVEYCKVLELLPGGDELLLRAGVGWQDGLVGKATVGSELDSQAGYTLYANEPVIVVDLHRETRFSGPALLRDHQVVSGLSVIIQGHEHPYGVLGAHSTSKRQFSSDDVNFLQSMANLLGAAIERKRVEGVLVTLNADLERRVAERTASARLLQEVAVAANQAASIESAFQFALERICRYTGWPVGHVYLPSTRGEQEVYLEPTRLWYLADSERFQKFRQTTEATTFKPGTGLPGQVFQSGQPAWFSDVTKDGQFTRAKAANQNDIRAAFAFPVLAGQEVAAVLEFFTTHAFDPDASLLEVMGNIGTQLGRVVERQRLEAMLLRHNEELLHSQEQLEEAQKMARIGSWDWHIPSNTIHWSAELYRIYGLDEHTFDASLEGWLERVHPEDRQATLREVEQAYAEARPFEVEHRIIRPDGSVRILLGKGKVILDDAGQPIKMVGTGQDITKRREMEEALHQSLALLENLFESAPDGTILVNADGRIIRINRQMERMSGYARDELLGQSLEVLLPAKYQEQHKLHRGILAKDPQRRSMGAGLELFARRKDGSEFPVDVMLSPLETNQGVQVIAVVRDISQRRLAEEALRQSEARFRSVFEDAAMGMAIVDPERRILLSNPVLQSILGYSAEELRGMDKSEITHPLDLPATLKLYEELIEGECQRGQIEKRYIRKDGQEIWCRVTLSVVRGAQNRPRFVIVMSEDITARKQMEAELAEVQQRMMAGREMERMRLAQELHDVPLQDLYVLLYQLNDLDEVVGSPELLDKVKREQAEGIRQVINTLRTICGELRSPTLSPFGLEGAIREHAEQFQAKNPELDVHLELMSDNQTLSEDLRINLFRIYQQALNNVIRHAHAANVTVRFQFDEKQAVLEIEDDGLGFEVPRRWIGLAREGHLGLLGAAERAEMIGGSFQVISNPGKGTLVRVKVPRNTEQIAGYNKQVVKSI